MRFLAIITTLTLAASSAFALHPTTENTDPVTRALSSLPACQPPSSKTGIIRPKVNATLYTEKPFLFSFCSPTYFKTSSKEILVGFENDGGDSANLVAINVSPSGYTQNLTFFSSEVSAGARKLVVYEVQNGYYNRYNFVKYIQPVKVKTSSS
ncbi:hypothetical protein CF327_g2103 [Tilletia walkeri]|uniref:Uncharacterized protein n=1 Tax=Tilletia walkeri TaxID=117179 RepID=A0A8X7T8I3_9BASI|nr:hypothetical protein CF327_g2103 [Tilletia walkeri]KAE8271383.1 hypothetical protein A4X09_0g978 [Tilletia walkeri]